MFLIQFTDEKWERFKENTAVKFTVINIQSIHPEVMTSDKTRYVDCYSQETWQ